MTAPSTSKPTPRPTMGLVVRRWLATPGGTPLVTEIRADRTRTEQSGPALANGVAKAANFFAEELLLEPGDCVTLLATAGWQVPAIVAGAWQVGVTVRIVAPQDATSITDDVVICDVARAGSTSRPCFVLSDHPWGLPLGDATPPGTTDLAPLLQGQPDQAAPDDTDDAAARLIVGSIVLTGADLVTRAAAAAQSWGLPPGGRLGTAQPLWTMAGALACLAVPAVAQGSVLIHAGAPEPATREALTAEERIDAWARGSGTGDDGHMSAQCQDTDPGE